MFKKSFTLIELIVVFIVSSLLIFAITSFAAFFIREVKNNTDRYNMYSQMNYAFNDMKFRCSSAIVIDPLYTGNTTPDPYLVFGNIRSRPFLQFLGERDPYVINDENVTMWDPAVPNAGTKVWYRYCIDDGVGVAPCVATGIHPGDLVLAMSIAGGGAGPYELYETLIDAKYLRLVDPIRFIYIQGDEPNFIVADLKLQRRDHAGVELFAMNMTEGIVFRYVNIR